MSPSEDRGLAMGLRMVKFERHKRTSSVGGKLVSTRVCAQFESPMMLSTKTIRPGTVMQRHTLHSFAKSRAGAWMHAIRWLRQLQKGKLA